MAEPDGIDRMGVLEEDLVLNPTREQAAPVPIEEVVASIYRAAAESKARSASWPTQ